MKLGATCSSTQCAPQTTCGSWGGSRPHHAEKSKVVYGVDRSPFDHEGQIHFVEAGADGGRFSAVIPGWVGNYDILTNAILS